MRARMVHLSLLQEFTFGQPRALGCQGTPLLFGGVVPWHRPSVACLPCPDHVTCMSDGTLPNIEKRKINVGGVRPTRMHVCTMHAPRPLYMPPSSRWCLSCALCRLTPFNYLKLYSNMGGYGGNRWVRQIYHVNINNTSFWTTNCCHQYM